MDNLINELKKKAEKTEKNARQNYFAAYAFSVITVVASITATILAGIGAKSEITATCAAIPAAMLAISSTFKFEQKSAWHWKKNKRIKSLLRSLENEGEEVSSVSRKLSILEEEMDSEWISFGSYLKNGHN